MGLVALIPIETKSLTLSSRVRSLETSKNASEHAHNGQPCSGYTDQCGHKRDDGQQGIILQCEGERPIKQLAAHLGKHYGEARAGDRQASEHGARVHPAALPQADPVVEHNVRVEPVTFHNRLVDEQVTDWLFFATD